MTTKYQREVVGILCINTKITIAKKNLDGYQSIFETRQEILTVF